MTTIRVWETEELVVNQVLNDEGRYIILSSPDGEGEVVISQKELVEFSKFIVRSEE